MTVYVGGTDELTFTVAEGTAGTGVTVTLVNADGQTLTPTPVTTDGGVTWTAAPQWPTAGKWVATWTVTGPGVGTWPQEIVVSGIPRAAALVEWRPERHDVAAYCTGRTLVGAQDGYGNVIDTFDSTTVPHGVQVDRLITGAVAWVTAGCGTTLAETWWEPARTCAAIRAAGMVELTYPHTEGDVNTSAELLKQAAAMRDDLRKAIVAEGGDDPTTPGDNLLPVWSFPSPSAAGDLLL